jgi:hypothetical protein
MDDLPRVGCDDEADGGYKVSVPGYELESTLISAKRKGGPTYVLGFLQNFLLL